MFAAAAAVGGGIAVVVDQALHHAEITARASALSVALPAAVYVLAVLSLHLGGRAARPAGWAYPVAACCLVAAALAGLPILVSAAVMVVLVATTLVGRRQLA